MLAINSLLSIGLLWLAVQLWNLRRALQGVAQGMESAARSTHAILGQAPENIAIGQHGIHGFRQNYRNWEPGLAASFQRVTWALSLIQQFNRLWPGSSQGRSPKKPAKGNS
ncbi:MAG: hypothetical protein EA001_07155 [Oscillatoriales cyanobacterium]|nr:MAG: hypothetical protein EA001_07155 [Oscillatoriales cyanobacterium]